MGHSKNDAAAMDALIKSSVKECAGSMVLRSNGVAVQDVLINLRVEVCALGTEHRKRSDDYAAVRDALIKFKKEGYARSMGPSTNDATLKDVPIYLRKAECV